MVDFAHWMEDAPVDRSEWRALVPVAVLFALLLVLASPVLPAAQDPASPAEIPTVDEPAADDDPEAIPEVREVDRILRIRRVLELDGQRLRELRRDRDEKDELLDRLARALVEMEADQVAWNAELEALDPEGDPEERETLERRIARLEIDLDLYKTQADLEHNSAQTYRDSIEALEKKLEREQRALDRLAGMAVGPGEAASRAVESTPVADSGSPGMAVIPGMPRTSRAPTSQGQAAATARHVSKPETAAQIAARREVERRLKVVEEAEWDLVEYVKRKESLELQIGFERKLIANAEGSRDNLSRALEVNQADLEAARTAEAKASEIREWESNVLRVQGFRGEAVQEIEERTAYVATLEERLETLLLEEATLTRTLDGVQEEAEDAARASLWLESPIHPANVVSWLKRRGPRMLLVLVVALSLLVLIRLTVRRVARIAVGRRRGRRRSLATNRADTLAFSFKSAASMAIIVGGVILILQEAGVDVRTVLGGAAIFGVAIAFGAQNLMRDYFTGFMILLEDQYELGDLVTIDGITGTVERVNMRTTVLRDLEGRVHFIPNGNVRSVTNRTYEWGRAVLDVPVGYKENVDEVMGYLLEVAEEFRADPEFSSWVTNEPVMLGVDKFTEYGVVIKFMAETRPDKIFPARRELLRRVKNKFDEKGIEISVPHRIVIRQPEEDRPS